MNDQSNRPRANEPAAEGLGVGVPAAEVVDVPASEVTEVPDEAIANTVAELSAGDAYLDFTDEDDPEQLLGLTAESEPDHYTAEDPRPVVAVVGRPNVGKSSLVNRVLRRRLAVVEDVPGVTRDRVAYDAEWNGRDFILVDTGGWDTKVRGLAASVAAQAERAMHEADVVMLVVDATVGATDADEAVVKVLRRAGVPVILAANKCDDARSELEASALWGLGLGEPYPVSALHGRGSGDLLDALVAAMPTVGRGAGLSTGPRRVALLGKPNVGKSSLLNRMAGTERVVVDDVAGTTVDSVDELVEIAGQEWLFIDTAGIRRRVREASGQEYYASLRTRTAVDKAQVVVVLMDASEQLTEQDARLVSMVVDAGRALVVAMNKWDLVDDERRHYLDREYDRDLAEVHWAPRVNLSARTGRHVERLVPALTQALDSWTQRVSTGRLNNFLRELREAHPHPLRGGKQPRILFGTQASTCPPTFVLFTTGFLEAGYRRFIERRLREEFGFAGTPIRIELRIREKRQRR